MNYRKCVDEIWSEKKGSLVMQQLLSDALSVTEIPQIDLITRNGV